MICQNYLHFIVDGDITVLAIYRNRVSFALSVTYSEGKDFKSYIFEPKKYNIYKTWEEMMRQAVLILLHNKRAWHLKGTDRDLIVEMSHFLVMLLFLFSEINSLLFSVPATLVHHCDGRLESVRDLLLFSGSPKMFLLPQDPRSPCTFLSKEIPAG